MSGLDWQFPSWGDLLSQMVQSNMPHHYTPAIEVCPQPGYGWIYGLSLFHNESQTKDCDLAIQEAPLNARVLYVLKWKLFHECWAAESRVFVKFPKHQVFLRDSSKSLSVFKVYMGDIATCHHALNDISRRSQIYRYFFWKRQGMSSHHDSPDSVVSLRCCWSPFRPVFTSLCKIPNWYGLCVNCFSVCVHVGENCMLWLHARLACVGGLIWEVTLWLRLGCLPSLPTVKYWGGSIMAHWIESFNTSVKSLN